MNAALNYLATHGLEAAGVCSTVLSIWLTTKRKLLCWPIMLLANSLYLTVFFQAKLYSGALLQIVFIAVTIYGWLHWWRDAKAEGEVRIVALPTRGWIAGLAAGAVGAVLLGWAMARAGASLPHLDAALASYSLIASWWQTRRHIANWWLWIALDTIYIGEYIYKSLFLTAALYAALVGLAVLGLRNWGRAAKA
jgi:nicotinamide mononucleotide transporter